jgi:hypothetical protein
MFRKLFAAGPEDDQEIARVAYEKVVASRLVDSREARSARTRMGLLCRAHLDKTFIDGAEQTAVHQDALARALVQGKEKPEEPQAPEFQCIKSGGRDLWVYVPQEYADQAFALGGRYQKTELSAEQAILEMQSVADQIFLMELKLEQSFEVLQFLREELTQSPGSSGAGALGIGSTG